MRLCEEELDYRNIKEYVSLCNGCPLELPDDFEEIEHTEKPSFLKWKFIPMYKIDQNGNKWVWQTGFDGELQWILHGPMTSTTIDSYVIEMNTRSKSLVSQALVKCRYDYRVKFKKGYAPLGEESKYKEGMGGHQYKPGCIKRWPRMADVKLDGHRMHMYCSYKDNSIKFLSRKNECMDHLNHIKRHARHLISFLPPNTMLDGELYNHKMTRSQISSIVRSYKNHKSDAYKICFYLFDIYFDRNPCIEERYKIMCKAYNSYIDERIAKGRSPNSYIRLVPKWIVKNEKQAQRDFESVLELGYEGIMLKTMAAGYKEGTKEYEMSRYHFGKSVRVHKMKAHEDCEGKVVDVQDCKGKEAGMAKLVVKDPETGSNIAVRFGTHEDRKKWLKKPKLVIGRTLQYKFSSRHEKSNLPIEPTGVCWREVMY